MLKTTEQTTFGRNSIRCQDIFKHSVIFFGICDNHLVNYVHYILSYKF